MSPGDELVEIAAEIDSLAERLADRSLELLRSALDSGPKGPDALAERSVTRARRALEKASAVLRAVSLD